MGECPGPFEARRAPMSLGRACRQTQKIISASQSFSLLNYGVVDSPATSAAIPKDENPGRFGDKARRVFVCVPLVRSRQGRDVRFICSVPLVYMLSQFLVQ